MDTDQIGQFWIAAPLLLVAMVAAWVGFRALDRFATRQHQHRFLGWQALLLPTMGAGLLVAGTLQARNGGNLGVAALLLAAGVLILGYVVVANVRRTGPLVGLSGSAGQLVAGTLLAALGPALAIPALLVMAARIFGRSEPTMRQHRVVSDNHSLADL